MNPPSLSTRVLGNALVCFAILGLAALLGYAWLMEGASNFVAFVAAVLALGALKERKALSDYKAWQRQWEAAGGVPPTPSSGAWYTRLGAGLAVYALLAYAVFSPGVLNREAHGAAAVALAILTVIVVGATLRAVWRRVRQRRAVQVAEQAKHFVVRPLLPVAQSTHGIRDAASQLPDYCRRLLSLD